MDLRDAIITLGMVHPQVGLRLSFDMGQALTPQFDLIPKLRAVKYDLFA